MKFLIIGAGLTGCYLARKIVDEYSSATVEIIEKREHIAGNCFDYFDEDGILTHKYGPHYFRTNSEEQKDWLGRFTDWIPAKYFVKASIDNQLYSMPINLNTISKLLGRNVNAEEFEEYLKENRIHFDSPLNAYEQCLSNVGEEIYNKFFKGYTTKQWGEDPVALLPELTARIPLRFNHDDRYVNEKFQIMPKNGYTALATKMVNHERIKIRLETDYFDNINKYAFDKMIYTGELDRFFNYKLGKLKYRSLRFEKKNFANPKDGFVQEFVQYNYPVEHDYTRSVEIKHVTGQQISSSNVIYEYPVDDGEPFYPFLNQENKNLAQKYRELAIELENDGIYFSGRLADFRYYNMDQALHAAEKKFLDIKKSIKSSE